jgi:hypothetical protein
MNIEISLNSIICTSHSYFAYFHFDSTPIDKHAEHFHWIFEIEVAKPH